MKRRIAEIWIVITSDKRKALALAALVVLAGGLWIRAALVTNEKQTRAPGATSSKATTRAASATRAKNAKPENESALPPRSVVMIPPTRVNERDLFRPDAVLYPPPSQTESTTTITPKPASGSADNPQVDAEALREAAVRTIRAEASRLRLRSTMTGTVPIAVIETDERGADRAVLRPGDSYLGFTLVEVSPRSAIVEKNGVRVELTISLP